MQLDNHILLEGDSEYQYQIIIFDTDLNNCRYGLNILYN